MKKLTSNNKSHTISNDSFILDKLNIVINDKFGNPVTGFLDWSFSLFVEYDDNNNNKQEFLNLEY